MKKILPSEIIDKILIELDNIYIATELKKWHVIKVLFGNFIEANFGLAFFYIRQICNTNFSRDKSEYLDWVCANCDLDVIKFLYGIGAKYDSTSVDIAIKRNHINIVEYLINVTYITAENLYYAEKNKKIKKLLLSNLHLYKSRYADHRDINKVYLQELKDVHKYGPYYSKQDVMLNSFPMPLLYKKK